VRPYTVYYEAGICGCCHRIFLLTQVQALDVSKFIIERHRLHCIAAHCISAHCISAHCITAYCITAQCKLYCFNILYRPKSVTLVKRSGRYKYRPRTSRLTKIILHSSTMADVALVNVVPGDERVVEVVDFVPSDLIVDVMREDGGSCNCGQWYFYSSTCTHVYQHHISKCGRQRTRAGVNSAFCPKTSTRTLVSKVKVRANCPSVSCA
jgi:hypothetical protein